MYKNINKLSTVFKNNHTYLVGAFTLFSLFGIVLILLGAITKNINWAWGGVSVIVIGIAFALTLISLGIFAITAAIKERKLKKEKQ
ncbi:hypothetical protein [Spiroplasma poulsonii]|uniref:hypothetical protein n=1 Tax=Spiroplasma poulsonii TaxID=2138 RepID=UPI001F4CCD5A|nr:hypothetical protein [Spiroplasma poulsonii]UNF62710.1 hypothetical protein MNU24_08265 [Spiroplasma poulsonii]